MYLMSEMIIPPAAKNCLTTWNRDWNRNHTVRKRSQSSALVVWERHSWSLSSPTVSKNSGRFVWIPVNSLANLQAAYYEVAKKLCLPGCETNGAHILESVQTYLSNESIDPWLLVLDNADDFDLWVSPLSSDSSKCLVDCLPRSKQGSIIFTTRNWKVINDLVQDMVAVSEMGEPEAIHLLKTTAGVNEFAETNCHAVPIILEKLTYLPLAIVQAVSYIRRNWESFSRYTNLLMDQEDNVIDILGEEFRDTERYHDINNVVAKTWIISFQQICRDDPSSS